MFYRDYSTLVPVNEPNNTAMSNATVKIGYEETFAVSSINSYDPDQPYMYNVTSTFNYMRTCSSNIQSICPYF